MSQKIDEKLSSFHYGLAGRLPAQNLFCQFLDQKDVAGHCQVRLKYCRSGRGDGVLQLFSDAAAHSGNCIFDVVQFLLGIGLVRCTQAAGKCHPAYDDNLAVSDSSTHRNSKAATDPGRLERAGGSITANRRSAYC